MSDDKTKKIVFLASIPAVQSALKISGDAGGMRLHLDIPENQMVEAAYLIAMRQSILKVTVEVYEQTQQPTIERESTAIKRTSAKKRD